MKKLLLIALIGLYGLSTQAQGLDFGIKAGVNFANITDATGLDNRTGFVGGLFLGAKLSDNLGIQVDALYSQQGAEFDLGSFNLDYINIPMVLKYYVAGGLNIQLGPQFGVLIDDDTQTVVGEVINDIATNDFDISGVVGLGLDIPFGLRLEGRYNFGLTDVPDEPAIDFDKGKNSVVTLSLGYSFL
jgi:hypothetical protein